MVANLIDISRCIQGLAQGSGATGAENTAAVFFEVLKAVDYSLFAKVFAWACVPKAVDIK